MLFGCTVKFIDVPMCWKWKFKLTLSLIEIIINLTPELVSIVFAFPPSIIYYMLCVSFIFIKQC